MIVISLTDCPIGLRGDLSKWLLEISSGVFVGQVNARVRDLLWKRIKEMCKNGRAVMVYATNNEQRLAFRVLGDTWEPIDFDGLTLMLRPSPSRIKIQGERLKPGYSKAAQARMAERRKAGRFRLPVTYMVVDVETTGLDPERDEIMELSALAVAEHIPGERYHAFIKIEGDVPVNIERLTSIAARTLAEQGLPARQALEEFFRFLGNKPIVGHNVDFDRGFLRNSCAKQGLPLFTNRCIDTLQLAKRLLRGMGNYKLDTLCSHFNIEREGRHQSMKDCEVTQKLYEKLMNLMDDE